MLRRLVIACLCALSALSVPGVARADWGDPSLQGPQRPMVFPVLGKVSFSDTFRAPRGTTRLHDGQDLMGAKMQPLVATVEGTVTSVTIPEPSYGYALTITGDDGWSYHYLHINNDTPGTDDGLASLEHVYAPGIRKGARVNAGQVVAYLGDSGNAESTAPHLHFELRDPDGVAINAYASLRAATRLTDPAAPAPDVPPLPRLAGLDRVRTAIEASRSAWSSAANVVLAAGDRYEEALPASVLAAKLSGPLLLVGGDGLGESLTKELVRLKASAAVVVGSVPAAVDVELAALGLSARRIAGADPASTAAALAAELGATGRTAVVVNGERFADGISAAALAAGRGWPVLLTGEAELPAATLDALAALRITRTYVVGGTAVVRDAVLAAVPGGERLAGDDRYATSVAVGGRVLDLGGRLLSRTYLATGTTYPDALTAGALAARTRGVVLLVDGTGGDADAATRAFVEANSDAVGLRAVLGGFAAVNLTASAAIARLFGIT